MRSASITWSAVSLKWCVGSLFAFVVANLPYRYGEFAPETLGDDSEFRPNSSMAYSYQTDAIYGGWPWHYVSLPSPSPPTESLRWASATWSFEALLSNFAVAFVAVAAVTLIVSLSLRAATTVAWGLALLAIGWGVAQAHRDRTIAERLMTHATVYRSALVPVWITKLVPSIGLQPFTRIRGVMLCEDDPEAMAIISQLPDLHTLGLWNRLPPVDQLQALRQRPQLCKLVISQVEIADWLPKFIASQSSLRHLELSNCRGLASGLAELEQLPRLEVFNASGSDLPLACLSDVSWVNRLRRLQLSHPLGGEQTLELSECHKLEVLQIGTTKTVLNPDLLTVRLDGMPRLSMLLLASSQKISLSIAHAPRLQELRVVATDERSYGLRSSIAPLGLWLERLSLINVPSLKKLHCYGADLQDILIQQSPNLIDFTVDLQREGEYQPPDVSVTRRENLSGLIRGLAKCSGPLVIDLSTLPLQGIDLAPLAQNQRIRELRLANTGVKAEQLQAVLTLPRLKTLDVRNCPISNAEAAELLYSSPQLKHFLVNSEEFDRIEVTDRMQLADFTVGASPQASLVRIAGCPQLRSKLLLGPNLQTLHIEDGCSLQGLSINGPLPLDTTLQGLRDLRFLALGGPRVDDRLCEPIWQCTQIGELTLAYTSLSREAWSRVAGLRLLKTLIIPGADIDDSVTDQWRDLEHLRVVDFSHTRVSRRTLAQLLRRPNLQRLALNFVDLSKGELQGLENVLQLIELEVAGIGLEEQALAAILDRGLLDRLDLSDSVLTPGSVQILCSKAARKLYFLGLRNCGLQDADVRLIAEAQPQLIMDVEGNPISDALRQQLHASNRLLSRCDREGFLRRIAPAGNPVELPLAASATTFLGETCDKIDVHQFAPVTAVALNDR